MEILHAMMVRSDPQKIYRALTEADGLSAWFGPECRAEPQVGSLVEVHFHDRHDYSLKFEITELEPAARVVWKVIQAIPSWDDFPSTLTWTLIPDESSTIVHLRHSGWPEGHDALPSVSFKWTEFMRALRTYVHTGEKGTVGKPALEEFFAAVRAGEQAAVETLLAREPALLGARDENGLSPVLAAVYFGEPGIAVLLIERGAPLDLFDSAAAGRLERVRQWVEARPERANATAADGFQPLGLAAFFGHTEVAGYLLERGAEVNSPSRNPQRVMPLHSAAAGRHLEIARLLLEHGAEVNARQEGGFTPLHSAAQNRQVELVRLLLAHGADPQARAEDGRTPADLADLAEGPGAEAVKGLLR